MATLQDLLDQRRDLEDKIADCLRDGEADCLRRELATVDAAIAAKTPRPEACCT